MNVAAPWAQTPQRMFDRAAIAVLAVVAIIAALTFKDYGLGWDDYTHAEYGDLLLDLYRSGFTDQRALHFVNLYAYGGGFDMLAAYVAKWVPFDLWETRRLCGAIVGIFGLTMTWSAARRIGGPLAGLIALVLLAACPLYYGHMFMNPKDGPFAAMMALALLATVRVFEEYPRPSAKTIAMVGIGFGLAIGTRILGGFAVVDALIVLAFVVVAEWRARGPYPARQRFGAFALKLLPAVILAYAVMALVWPWSVANPANPVNALVYFSHFFETPWRELFAGQLIMVPDMPRIYVTQLLLLKLPEIMLLLGGCGIAGTLFVATRRDVLPQRRAVLLAAAIAALLPVALTLITRPAMYNGIRHFTFLTPAIAVLGGWAGAVAIEWTKEKYRSGAIILATAMAAALALPITEMIKLHPYQYVSFNRIAGGVPGADPRYMLDYWGLAFKQAASELNALLAARGEQPPAGRDKWRIAVCGPQRPAQVELGIQYDISWDPKDAQFVMSLGEFYCQTLNAPVIVEVKREGIVFARVYDIRGKNFTSILTSGK